MIDAQHKSFLKAGGSGHWRREQRFAPDQTELPEAEEGGDRGAAPGGGQADLRPPGRVGQEVILEKIV